MRTLLLLALLSFYSLYSKADSWTSKAPFPGSTRWAPFSFTIDGIAYAGGGFNGSTGYDDVWSYYPGSDSWTQKADFPGTNKASCVGFSIGKKGYVCTGATMSGGASRDLWEYDPETDTWTQKPYFPGIPRYYALAFVIDSIAYVGTGYNGNHDYSDFYAYNKTTNSWSAIAPLPDSGGAGAAFAILNKGYVIGTAAHDSSVTTFSRRLWQYDPLTNSWTAKADLPDSGRICGLSFVINDKGYYGLGNNVSGILSDLWQYDPATDTWAQKLSVNTPFSYREGTSFSLGNKGYITLGDATYDLLEYSLNGIGVKQINSPSVSVHMFPNPFTTTTAIIFDRELINGSITLSDMHGKVVVVHANVSGKEFQLNRKELPAGMYLCIVREQDITVATEQIIVR